jgi:hypothetical protein
MDIETFYEADERRRRSEEIELGTDWYDAAGARYEVSWVCDTGELYVMREPLVPLVDDPFGDIFRGRLPTDELTVAVVAWIADRARLEAILTGWPDEMAKPDGISWLAERLRQAGVPRQAPDPV